jgi:superfamily II DNA/RNA helicase
MKFLPSVTVMSIGTVKDIDIADIDWVFQFNAPSCASDFIHRCGRTARIGNRGTTLAFSNQLKSLTSTSLTSTKIR